MKYGAVHLFGVKRVAETSSRLTWQVLAEREAELRTLRAAWLGELLEMAGGGDRKVFFFFFFFR